MAFSDSGSKYSLSSPADQSHGVFKLIILGDKNVGKTTLVTTFVHREDNFERYDKDDYNSTSSCPSYIGPCNVHGDSKSSSYPTFKFRSFVTLGQTTITLNIWDTAG